MRRCLHIAIMHSRYVKKGRSRFVVAAIAIPTLGKLEEKLEALQWEEEEELGSEAT